MLLNFLSQLRFNWSIKVKGIYLVVVVAKLSHLTIFFVHSIRVVSFLQRHTKLYWNETRLVLFQLFNLIKFLLRDTQVLMYTNKFHICIVTLKKEVVLYFIQYFLFYSVNKNQVTEIMNLFCSYLLFTNTLFFFIVYLILNII